MAVNGGVNIQSIQGDIKLRKSEHFVSYTMVVDKAFWDLEIGAADDTRSYISDIAKNGGFVSQKFTADDDGEVFWRVRIECDDPRKPKFKVNLDLEFDRTDIHVLLRGYVFGNVKSEIRKKMPDENYRNLLVVPRKSAAIFTCTLDAGFEKVRFDISYAKVEKIGYDNASQPWVLQPTANKQIKSLVSGIATLLKNSIASDVTLRCHGVQWKLHKNILGASSKIFAAMFSHEMKENTEGVVDIEDVDSNVLDLMIKFIYNAEIVESELKKAAETLLILADKYDLPVLKETCEEILIPQLSVENCLRLFSLGQKHFSPPLVSSAKLFLTRNFSEICKNEEYNVFARENMDLVIEITREAFKVK